MKAAPPKARRRVIRDEGPDPIDVFVGKRVRERRRHENLSQTILGGRLGVTFQAVQKYESGGIRISASTLYRLVGYSGLATTRRYIQGDGRAKQNVVGMI